MAFRYVSGEEIKQGDVVILHGKPGRIDLIVEGRQEDPAANWHFTEFGGGIRISGHEEFGVLFIPIDQMEEDDYDFKTLEFVSRG